MPFWGFRYSLSFFWLCFLCDRNSLGKSKLMCSATCTTCSLLPPSVNESEESEGSFSRTTLWLTWIEYFSWNKAETAEPGIGRSLDLFEELSKDLWTSSTFFYALKMNELNSPHLLYQIHQGKQLEFLLGLKVHVSLSKYALWISYSTPHLYLHHYFLLHTNR